MITSGTIHQNDNIEKNQHEIYIINLKNINVGMEIINDNLCITLENKVDSVKQIGNKSNGVCRADISSLKTDNSNIYNI